MHGIKIRVGIREQQKEIKGTTKPLMARPGNEAQLNFS